MSLRTSLAIALALGVLGFMPKASAYPYLVYSGSISTTSVLAPAEATAVLGKLETTNTAYYAKFEALPAVLRSRIGTYLVHESGAEADLVYMVTDEANVDNYVVVIVDPTGNKVISTAINGTALTAAQEQNAFISGFKYTRASSKGGLGLFRFTFSHTTHSDPASVVANAPTTGSYVVQATATGPINDNANLILLPARPAQTLRVVTNGVVKPSVSLPYKPSIVLTAGDTYIASLTGTVQGYYFDDTSSTSVAATTTAGVISLACNAVLTNLANNGGGYAASARNVGYIPAIPNPISVHTSPVAAFQTFVNNIISVYPNPAP